MNHLTALALDEAASGLPLEAEDAQHLEGCGVCRERVTTLTQANRAILSQATAAHLLKKFTDAPGAPTTALTTPTRSRTRRWGLLVAAALPLAAGLAMWLAPTQKPDDGLTFKGAVSLELLNTREIPTTRAHPDDELTLAVGAAGHRFGAVFAIDENGSITPLYPKRGDTMGPLLGTARQKLDHLTVTPGNTLVIAFFADTARPLSELHDQLHASLVEANSPFDVTLPGTARLLLKVE